jgi:EAL domain-containing protein (putative c-di-GMP-specific phosphodiesterase class I)
MLPDHDPMFISVNLSAQNFLEDDLADYFARTLMVAGVDPHRVVVEVTETALIRDPDRTIQQLTDLRALGLRIALDDFGTGYSSLSYLHRLPVDILKIAQPFIADVENDETFVRTMIDLGKNLGLQIVAEGVETEAQRLRVAELGCDLAQGYLFGRPSTLTDLMGVLAADRV